MDSDSEANEATNNKKRTAKKIQPAKQSKVQKKKKALDSDEETE